MKIAVASGKGGTGKTTVASSLALSLTPAYLDGSPLLLEPLLALPPMFMDCDVEAPNAHLFLHPAFEVFKDAAQLIPEVDHLKCTYCGTCAQVCQYHAIAVVGENVLVFPQLCHACGSCMQNCPTSAISEVGDVIGQLSAGPADEGISFMQGKLNIGEPMAVPVIHKLKHWLPVRQDQIVILDSPPGTSCPVVETMRGADFILLVTEPTPFGLHDLKLAVEVVRSLQIPLGVVINRDGLGDDRVDRFCEDQGIPVLMRIPYSRQIAEGIARGKTLLEVQPEFAVQFQHIFEHILAECSRVRGE